MQMANLINKILTFRKELHMTSNVKYQQSIAAEFIAIKDRVRFFIEDNHWGEDGRYKELILINYLRKVLPENVAVGTGFVRNANDQLTNQIDIIIYKKNDPKLFHEGDFVILMPESVIGIIEVKSKLTRLSLYQRLRLKNGQYLPSTIDKCNYNGAIIENPHIFNGIFSYETDIKISNRLASGNMGNQLRQRQRFLNHICFNQDFFMRYWADGNPKDRTAGDNRPSFSFYDLSYSKIFGVPNNDNKGLAFGYFISNLLEVVYSIVAPHVLNKQYFEFLYPLKNTKEAYRLNNCDIKIDL